MAFPPSDDPSDRQRTRPSRPGALPQQEEAAEELAEQPQAASYTADMDVSEITQRMTVDEAKTVVVQLFL